MLGFFFKLQKSFQILLKSGKVEFMKSSAFRMKVCLLDAREPHTVNSFSHLLKYKEPPFFKIAK